MEEKEVVKTSRNKYLIGAIVIIAIIFSSFMYYQNMQKQAKTNYEEELRSTVLKMLSTSTEAEDIVNIYSKFWRLAIDGSLSIEIINKDVLSHTNEVIEYAKVVNYSKPLYYRSDTIDDFNTALSVANLHLTKRGKIEELENNKTEIASKMRELNKPPVEYEKAYEIAFEIYSLQEEYVSLAISPTGSLMSFNEKTSNLSSQIIKKLKEFEVMIPLD